MADLLCCTTETKTVLWSNYTPIKIFLKNRIIISTKKIIQSATLCPLIRGSLISQVMAKCPSTDEWIKKMWYIYIMEYYAAIKRNKIGSFVETWMDLETVIQREWSKSVREKQISYINEYMWSLEKWYRSTGLQIRNRDTDVENKCMDTKGGKWWGVVVVVVVWIGRLGLTYIH